MQEPRFGAPVRVRAKHARVQKAEAALKQFLAFPAPMDGVGVIWDRHWRSRWRDGDVEIVPSAPIPPASPVPPLVLPEVK